MKKFIFLLFFFFYLNNANSNNFVYLDVQYIIDNSKLGKFYKEEIKVLQNQNTSELKTKKKEITDLELEIKNKKNVLSENEIGKKVNELNILIKNYQILRNKLHNKIVKMKKNYTENILKTLNPILTNHVKVNDIKVVLDKKNVLVGIKTLDITDIILTKLDESSKIENLINEN